MAISILTGIRERFGAAVQAFTEPESVQAHGTDVLTGPAISVNGGRGNQFTSYKAQVERAWQCWKNRTQYGGLPVRAVLRFWRAWIAGNGANLSGETEDEEAYIAEFLESSPLDSSLAKKVALGYLIEGRALLILTEGDRTSEIRYLKWIDYRYRLIRDPRDRSRIDFVEFVDSNGTTIRIPDGEFVYVSEDDDEDEPPPPIAPVLTPALQMEQAKADWRDMNHHWGSLGVNWETSGPEALKNSRYIARWLSSKDNKWEFGDTTAFPAKGTFPEPSGNGQESIKKEIDMGARFISGYSGIGIHLLGWASEMSNRATASELDEARVAATSDVRERLERAMRNAARMCYRNDTSRRGEIDATLPQVASHQLKELLEVWVPLEQGGYVTKEEVIERIPGVDPAKILAALEEKEAENVRRMAEENARIMREARETDANAEEAA